jgi:hypothetical protein
MLAACSGQLSVAFQSYALRRPIDPIRRENMQDWGEFCVKADARRNTARRDHSLSAIGLTIRHWRRAAGLP